MATKPANKYVIVEGASIILTRTGKNDFSVEFNGIKGNDNDIYDLFVGSTLTIQLPPCVKDYEDDR